jgi:hypothetical protein
MRTVFASFVLVSLSVFGVGCRDSKVGGTDQGVFTFQPTVGTAYTRTATGSRELALVGTPLRRKEVTRVVWRGNLAQEKDSVVAEETLDTVTLERDGAVLGQAKTVGKPVVIRYHFEKNGHLGSIEGTSDAADALVSLLPVDAQTSAAKEAVKSALEDTAFARSDDRFADVVGRPARVGETWTVTGAVGPDSNATPAAQKVYSVKAVETCELGTCMRVDQDVKLDPRLVAAKVQASVNEMLTGAKDEQVVDLKEGAYKLGSSTLVDPATMMTTKSKQVAEGTFAFQGPKRTVAVEIKLAREVEFAYPAK